MQVCFVTVQGDQFASRRLRTNSLALTLNKMGHECIVSDVPKQSDVVVFSKHQRPTEVDMAEACRGKAKVVFDICDDHLQGKMASHYLQMIHAADVVTCSTEEMAKRVRYYTAVEAKVIHDPYENALKAPRAPSQKKRVLWHGHSSNLPALQPLPEDYTLRVLCNKPSEIGEYIPWSLDELEKQLDWCDVVIIPQTDEPKNRVKTHNKATTSLRAGRYVVASNVQPEYAIYPIWRGDIEEGLKWAFDNPDNALKAVEKSQQISEQFSPDAMAKAWLEAVA